VSTVISRMDEEWPTDPATVEDLEQMGNGVTIPPKPVGPIQVLIVRRFHHRVPPPVHHTQGAKTIPGPILVEPER
jgi:hypothetical protein